MYLDDLILQLQEIRKIEGNCHVTVDVDYNIDWAITWGEISAVCDRWHSGATNIQRRDGGCILVVEGN